MDTAIEQKPAVVRPIIAANTFTLRNRRIAVSYSATSFTGQPLMQFKDRQHEVNVGGDEIRQVETEIGTLVTITLEPDADAGGLLFTLVVPRVVLASPNGEQTTVTQGFYTRSRLIPRLPANVQLQTYDAEELRGSASFVVS
ncbi:MAG TPA: hypothetical protein VNA24_12350 [Hyalangium sp.]|nr:hypothetical protein [Hyalangium sp.]